MDWPLRVSIALQTALAMEYLHEKGLIHRDLKSHNLLVDASEDPDDWTVKVCDFGLARKEDGGDFKTIVGTNKWMAPEVSMGESYGKSADVFSFGMVLLELITREKPPERKLLKGYAFEPEEAQNLIPKDTPPKLWEILKACTVFESDKRPTFSDVADQLLDIMEEMEGGGGDEKKKKKKKKDGKDKKKKSKK